MEEQTIQLFWQDVVSISVTNDGDTAVQLLNGCNVLVNVNGWIETDVDGIYIHNC
jgi:hypothetical protein